jgi:hypothetical protein
VLGVVALVLVVVGLFAWDAWRLDSAARELSVHAAAAQQAFKQRDAVALAAEVEAVQAAAREFAGATDGPHWWIANHLPWVKEQSRPLSVAGSVTLAIADGALEPLASMGSLDALQVPEMQDGRIDPYVLEDYKEPLALAAQVITEQGQRLEGVDLTYTVPEVAGPFRDLQTQLAVLGGIIVDGHVAAQVLPGMLGADGPRTYIVMVQNNAEPRPTGGIPGAVIELTLDDGEFSMGTYSTAALMTQDDGVDFAATEDEMRIFGNRFLIYPQNSNSTPEFPRTAQLMSAFWEAEHGEVVDGVVSIDPVALGYMLKGGDPVDVLDVRLTPATVAEVLLRDSYLLFPKPRDQDEFFALAAQQLFSQLLSGDTDVVSGTERAIDEHRFTVWSANAQEQEQIARTDISGVFLSHDNAQGIFLEDGSGSKIGYYIDTETSVANRICPDGRVVGQTVTMQIAHTFDGDVEALPWYVTGGGFFVPEGEFHGNVVMYPPNDMAVVGFERDGEPGNVYSDVHDNRSRVAAWIELKPGETTAVEFDLTANKARYSISELVVTPRAKPEVNALAVDSVQVDC